VEGSVGVCMVTYRGGFMVVGWRRGGSYMEVSWWFCGGEGGTVKVLGGVVSWWFWIIHPSKLGSSFSIYYVNEWERYVTKGLLEYTRVR